MGLTLLSESHGSSLKINKIINVDQGRPIINRQALSFETGWGTAVSVSLSYNSIPPVGLETWWYFTVIRPALSFDVSVEPIRPKIRSDMSLREVLP